MCHRFDFFEAAPAVEDVAVDVIAVVDADILLYPQLPASRCRRRTSNMDTGKMMAAFIDASARVSRGCVGRDRMQRGRWMIVVTMMRWPVVSDC